MKRISAAPVLALALMLAWAGCAPRAESRSGRPAESRTKSPAAPAATAELDPSADSRAMEAQLSAFKAQLQDPRYQRPLTAEDAQRHLREVERYRAGQPGRNKEMDAAEALVKERLGELEELSK